MAEKNDYLYTGREYDWETGIYYYRARYYNPELGRFLTRDPAGMVDGPNMYVYVKNSPVNGVDPTGKFSWYVDMGGVIHIDFTHEETETICTYFGLSSILTAAAAVSAFKAYFPKLAEKIAARMGASALTPLVSAFITYGGEQACLCSRKNAKAHTIVMIILGVPFFFCDDPTQQAHPLPTYLTAGYMGGTPFTPSYWVGSGGGGGRLGIQPMVFTPALGMPIPTPLPIAPIGSPLWRATI